MDPDFSPALKRAKYGEYLPGGGVLFVDESDHFGAIPTLSNTYNQTAIPANVPNPPREFDFCMFSDTEIEQLSEKGRTRRPLAKRPHQPNPVPSPADSLGFSPHTTNSTASDQSLVVDQAEFDEWLLASHQFSPASPSSTSHLSPTNWEPKQNYPSVGIKQGAVNDIRATDPKTIEGPQNNDPEKKKPKAHRNRAKSDRSWTHYIHVLKDEIDPETGLVTRVALVKCSYCDKTYPVSTVQTQTIRNHLQSKHSEIDIYGDQANESEQEEFVQDLKNLFLGLNLPFSILDRQLLRNFTSKYLSRYHLPSRCTLTRKVNKQKDKIVEGD